MCLETVPEFDDKSRHRRSAHALKPFSSRQLLPADKTIVAAGNGCSANVGASVHHHTLKGCSRLLAEFSL